MILITGSNGTVGRAVLEEVASSGEKHRAMYRSEADATNTSSRTEAVVADLADPQSLAVALRGVESVFLVCSPIPQLVELESNVIDASVQAGVKRIVLNSAMGAGAYAKSFPSWHRKVEDKLRATNLTYCILRPNCFLQNILTYYAPSIRAQGVFYGAMGNARNSFLDVRDIAVVASQALRGEHDGKICELNGPEALNYSEVAERISRSAGVAANYVDIPAEAQRKALIEQGMPDWQVTALLELQEYYTGGQGGTVDGVLQGLLGRAPITIDQFLRECAAEFRG